MAPPDGGVRLLAEDAEKQKTPKRPDVERQSVVGTKISGGRIWDVEQNSELDGDLWPIEAEQMLRTDPVVFTADRSLVNTQLTATWRWVVPDDAQPKAVEARDWLNEAFGFGRGRGYITGGWERALGQMLRFQPVGYRYMEEVYTVGPDRKVYVDFADCDPRAHDQWRVDDDGRLLEVVQKREFANGTSRKLVCPANKLILLTHGQTGGNFEGCGMLRPIWFAKRMKSHAWDQIAIGIERWAVPTPWVQIDVKALTEQGYSPAEIATMTANARESAKNYVGHESGYLSSAAGINFSAFGGDMGAALMPREVVRECNAEILTAFGLQFLMLGVNDSGGGRALSSDHSSFFRRLCIQGLDQVAATVGGDAGPGTGTLGRLMAWNFPSLDPAEWPRLTHEGLDPGPLLDLLPALTAAAGAGLITPRNALENLILTAIKAPPLTEEEEEARGIDQRLASGSPIGAAASLFSERNRRTL